jgi:hypothetical protein
MTECDGRASQRNITLNVIASGSEAIHHEEKESLSKASLKRLI